MAASVATFHRVRIAMTPIPGERRADSLTQRIQIRTVPPPAHPRRLGGNENHAMAGVVASASEPAVGQKRAVVNGLVRGPNE